MKRFRTMLMTAILGLLPALARAGEGLDIPEALEKKVPLKGLSGLNLFFAKAYNDNLLLYAVYCTVIMAAIGVIIAYGTDFILNAIGMETHKIEHKE